MDMTIVAHAVQDNTKKSVALRKQAMKGCWANVLDDCAGVISREHYVSDAFFSAHDVRVFGLPWCRVQPKTISLNSATKKILCRTHNSKLSELDSEVGRLMDTFREFSRLNEIRSKLKETPVQVIHFPINALRLERWFLKTLLNLMFEGRFLIGLKGTQVGVPPLDLVEIAFGLGRFDGQAGMYVGAYDGQVAALEETFEFSPLLKDYQRVLGGFFRVGDLHFYLCLEPEGVVVPFSQIPGVDSQWASTDLKWRFRKIKAMHGRYLSSVIQFNW